MRETVSDEVLIRRIAARDAQALEQLYDRYERPAYAFVFRMVKDVMAAEEVVQEMFVRIWNIADRIDTDGGRGKVSTWMFAVARNLAIDWLRKRGSKPLEALEYDEWERVKGQVEQETTEHAVERKLLGEQLKAALEELNEDQKQVLEWIYYKGYTQQEVADHERIPLGTVKSRVRLALNQLRKRFDEFVREGVWP
ncbi:RNA polymerase sigma24 factor [Paenibacillus darwinianus]|uniref:RNA polymerase sigma24 factor n=1 Tax=Paenibacillus darwinianus TaxID=1380763 RepID=A0A9W5RZD7_9BACL|nr:sigma-70 family RNA polymerase sigma factor [Paenibacillus darwinianus]EXX84850.1 RNA polymerase sigma24 factor [Paenibacillus darwinianus]EXX85451.1 RNA polymerase sigma24 factor [Paenibacillus darwinianus]EXX85627.1 RNA polymerase sigma24 factor [Paenibacillus darwinianus]